MGKNKLKKFAEMETFRSVYQYPRARLISELFPLKGKWREEYFHNDNPIVLELGCGKGEYTVGLARKNRDINYIGMDIKGARIWSGAKQAETEGLSNVAFIRSEIESLQEFFAPGEVDEIWITFPDPQMQKTRKRLTSVRFLEMYRHILATTGKVHLKTDSPFLFTFTSRLVDSNALPVLRITDDLYGSGLADPVTSIKTFYEQQWLSRGKKIKLLSFTLSAETPLENPDESDIERDDYRSFHRDEMNV
ncbi:MAG: tRNA (guanosine(46)-N7)-methyltransferase TrmB [Prevotella sp.]|nr:tRNA (guanosine(46)-N7)-methyltransferase TrmB [Bacteroides sp.]MCM1366196.1 tRNA (guanosine(46)-N7)-methyltransferase TrmB [Prevotella sp.]MCM1436948.1 tRNA (guanosine(46)-N7)-methyltransferase TrmB [Prevotella sp.]